MQTEQVPSKDEVNETLITSEDLDSDGESMEAT